MPYNNQKGFAPVLILVSVLILALTIGAGTYYIRNYTQIFKSNASEPVPYTEPVTKAPSSSPQTLPSPTTSTKISPSITKSVSGQIFALNSHLLMASSSADARFNFHELATDKITPFTKPITDPKQFIVSAIPSPDGHKLLITTFKSSENFSQGSYDDYKFYFCDIPCTELKTFDKEKIESQLQTKKYWVPASWVANSSNKIIIESMDDIVYSSEPKDIQISVLDLDSMELSRVITDKISLQSPTSFLLDTQADLLIIKNKDSSGQSIVSTYRVSDAKRSDFPVGKLQNMHYYNVDFTGGFGQFYASPLGENLEQAKSLEIKSITNQKVGLAALPKELESWQFSYKVYWSKSNNYFASPIREQNSAQTNTNKVLIFKKDGTFSGSINLDLITTDEVPKIYGIEGIIFSPDDKQAIISTYSFDNRQWKWYQFMIEPNAKITKTRSGPDLGMPLLWTD